MAAKIILVTGGSGMVGNAIQKISSSEEKQEGEKWYFASSKDGDLRNVEETRALFQRIKPTHVIHLAAVVGGLYKNLLNNVTFLRDNLKINDNVLMCCNEFKVTKCVSTLSTCIFPDKVTYPIKEEQLHKGLPHQSNMGYAYAKRVLEVQSKLLNAQSSCHFTSMTPCNIFGPYDNFSLEDGHVIAGLIRKADISKAENKPLVLWGTGAALRQFIYSLDLARLIIWVMREYPEEEQIILAAGEEEEVSIKELAEMVCQSMGHKGPINYDTTKSDGQLKKTVDISKLKSYRPDFKFTPLKQAIQETCDWYMKNRDKLRL